MINELHVASYLTEQWKELAVGACEVNISWRFAKGAPKNSAHPKSHWPNFILCHEGQPGCPGKYFIIGLPIIIIFQDWSSVDLSTKCISMSSNSCSFFHCIQSYLIKHYNTLYKYASSLFIVNRSFFNRLWVHLLATLCCSMEHLRWQKQPDSSCWWIECLIAWMFGRKLKAYADGSLISFHTGMKMIPDFRLDMQQFTCSE